MKTQELTGYPSIDKPWLKYYSEEAIHAILPECTIYEYLWENNKKNLDSIALNYFGREISFKKLFDEIDRAARAFRIMGVEAGDVCTVVTLSCVNSVIVFYALNKIGAVSNYINVISSEEEMEIYFKESASQYVVTMDLFADKVLKACGIHDKVVVFSVSDYMPIQTKWIAKIKFSSFSHDIWEDKRVIRWKEFLLQAKTPEDNIIYKKDASSVSIWAHTSGTTGFPKTVLLTDKAYNAVVMQYMKSMKHQRGETFLNIMVPFVVYGMLVCMHMPLCMGLTVVLIPKFNAAEWVRYLKKYKPNHIAGVPPYFSPMLSDDKLSNIDMSYLITIAAGGDGLNEKLENEMNEFLARHNVKAKLLKGYGMTEVCATAVTNFNNYTKIGSVGIPLVKNNVCIWDNDRKRECAYGEKGEICLFSPSLMLTYKNNREAVEDLIRKDSNGIQWVHTGDLGYMDEDGFLFIVGRMKRFMFVGSGGTVYKVLPQAIEDVIATISGVQEVCVVSVYNGSGFVPKAYVVLKEDCVMQQEDVRVKISTMCGETLADYMRPHMIEFLDSMPKTAVGKVDFQVLEGMG
ncbi:MAG: acyl--CoA ligase [Lachnoclostridium sp.]|nr:acyl--CoA ligase [Lachnospira sp.]MCM1247222.1 acyl--CoA ligase [Lachnoclostridium sp.]